MTLWPFQPSAQCAAMIPEGSYWFFNLASTSVDGCQLYIIIYYGMLQRDWGIRLMSKGGRPDGEFFKATDANTYIENHTNSLYVPKMFYDCPYEGWVPVIILVE